MESEKVFAEIENVDQENFHIILTGYRRDAYAKDMRNKFIETLNTLSKAAASLSSGPGGSLFTTVKTAVDNIVSIVDQFKDKFLKAVTAVAIESKGVTEKGLEHAMRDSASGRGEEHDDPEDGGAGLKERAVTKAKELGKQVLQSDAVQEMKSHAVEAVKDFQIVEVETPDFLKRLHVNVQKIPK